MTTTPPAPPRQRLVRALADFAFNFLFLALFLVAFGWYRRLLLAAHNIHAWEFWAPLLEALILAKLITAGDFLRVGQSLPKYPLVVSAGYRTAVFAILAVLFTIGEHIVTAWLRGKGLAAGLGQVEGLGTFELLARCGVIIAALFPFFAFKELQRVLGAATVRKLFFEQGFAADQIRNTQSPPT